MPLKTRKRTSKSSLQTNIKLYILKNLEMINVIKIQHWKTLSYSTHKSTDKLFENLNEHVDNFVEVMLGKTGYYIKTSDFSNIKLKQLNTNQSLVKYVNEHKQFLNELETKINIGEKLGDLANIRDEIVADLNEFLYLLRLK